MPPAVDIRAVFPRGGTLSSFELARRQTTVVRLLRLSLVALAVLAKAHAGMAPLRLVLELLPLLVLAGAASLPDVAPRTRTLILSAGLLAAALTAVHVDPALRESHALLVGAVVLVTLFEDWTVLGGAVGIVVVHGFAFGEGPASHGPLLAIVAGAAGLLLWTHNESVRLRMAATRKELEVQAETDPLTGLGNRRRLMGDLEKLCAHAEAASLAITIFDLNGFKAYNDVLGHQAGDELLQRLGARLRDAVKGRGEPYRLGGDEFCLISLGDAVMRERTISLAVDALTEKDGPFAIAASHGSVVVPDEVAAPRQAMKVADERMYVRKSGGRPSAATETKAALLQALSEREPGVADTLGIVSELAVDVATLMGLGSAEVEQIRHASELHDVGKLVTPKPILDKPGPLDESEWRQMRRHAEVGRRIIGAAPSLAVAADIVGASHERWDGTGYPHGLSGWNIPIGARIIAACDALDAMLTDRPYQAARTPLEALAELDRGSGTQFDPEVVRSVRIALGAQVNVRQPSA